jgi:hypothetical protein
MRTADLLSWHPRVERPGDLRQGELFHNASYGSSGGPSPAAVMPEWIARAAAAAELDARRQWGLRRRLRWALGRKR